MNIFVIVRLVYLKIFSFISLYLFFSIDFSFAKQRDFEVNQSRESLLLKKTEEVKIDDKIIQDVSAISQKKLTQLLEKFEDINSKVSDTDVDNIIQLVADPKSTKETKEKVFNTLTSYLKERSIIEYNEAKNKDKFHISSILEKIAQSLYVNKNLERTFLGLHADLSEAVFDNLNLSNARFVGANLTRTSFKNTDLTRADFTKAELVSAVLKKSILVEANFRLANLNSADFSETVLAGATLSSSFLSAVNSRISIVPIPISNLGNYQKRDIIMVDDDPKSNQGYKRFAAIKMKSRINGYHFKKYAFYEVGAVDEFFTPEEKPVKAASTPSKANAPKQGQDDVGMEDDASLLLEEGDKKEDASAKKDGDGGKTPKEDDASAKKDGDGSKTPKEDDASAKKDGNDSKTPKEDEASAKKDGDDNKAPKEDDANAKKDGDDNKTPKEEAK